MKISLTLAEQKFVGSCIYDCDSAEYGCTLIKSSEFTSSALVALFSAVEHCVSKGLDLGDANILYEILTSKGLLDAVGGELGVNLVAAQAGSKSNLPKYAEVIKREGLRLKARASVVKFLGAIEDGCPSETVNDLVSDLGNQRNLSVDIKGVKIKDALKEAWNNEDGSDENLSFGMFAVDKRFDGGVSPTSFTIVGAAPSTGKSAFATNIIINAKIGERPAKCLLLSMEMGVAEITDRLTACVSGVNISICKALRTGKAYDGVGRMGKEQYNNLTKKYGSLVFKAVDEIKKTDHVLRYHGLLTVSEFRALVSLHADEVDYIILDYIQQIKPEGSQTAHEKTNEISWTCKDVAMKYKKPVIALSQFNRGGYTDNIKPSMSDLRQSGQLEQDADNIILLWREKAHDVATEILEVNIAKNRNGAIGVSNLEFHLTKGIITNVNYESGFKKND